MEAADNVDREGQGTAELYELPNGTRLIRLDRNAYAAASFQRP